MKKAIITLRKNISIKHLLVRLAIPVGIPAAAILLLYTVPRIVNYFGPRMKYSILFSIAFFIFFSCSQKENKTVKVPQILIDIDKSAPLVLSEMFDEVSYVALSDSFPIGDIERIKIHKNRLLVLTNKSMLMYDTGSGKLILRIRNLVSCPEYG
jgi:hypothetical protein